jgi:FdhE protein
MNDQRLIGQPANTPPHIKAGLKRLDDLVKRTPEIAGVVAFYRAVIPILWEAQQNVPSFILDAAKAQQKLKSGQPLLVDEELPLDAQATADFFMRLCHIVERADAAETPQGSGWSLFSRRKSNSDQLVGWSQTGDDTVFQAMAARQIRQAIEQNQLDLAEVWQAIAMGERQHIEQMATRLKLDPDLLRILAQISLKPALHAWAQNLGPIINLDQWRRGYCPMCGNAPMLSEIQGKEGERRLRCSLCGTGWYYPRLQCPFCGCQGHKTLGYIAVEGEEEKYRLQTCESCRRYVKVVVTYDPIQPDLLLVEDLATLHLDLIANERDFVLS